MFMKYSDFRVKKTIYINALRQDINIVAIQNIIECLTMRKQVPLWNILFLKTKGMKSM